MIIDNDLPPIYDHPELYDATYRGRGKDYAGESSLLTDLIRARKPDAASLLDVACGTGWHLRGLADRFAHVEGLDLSPTMLRVAAGHLPGVPLHRADMRQFSLRRTFDAVVCLFSSIGYVDSLAQLNMAIACFARHLNPGGVLVVEPWWSPEQFQPNSVTSDVVTHNGQTIVRVSHAVTCGSSSDMTVHFLVGDQRTGVRHVVDRHFLSLFSRDEYEAAFTRAGCTPGHVSLGEGRPGLLVGVRAAGR